jgi:hypothetical protein
MHVDGRVLHRGEPQADCQMLAADEAARAVLAAAETHGDGRWAFDVPGEELLVFGRCRGDALGVVSARVSDGTTGRDLEMTEVAPTHELSIVLDGVPDELTPQIRLAPRRIGGVDLRWVHAPVESARSSALAGFSPDDHRLDRWAQAGRWWLTAQLLYVSAGSLPDGSLPDSWLPVAAHTDYGQELTAARDGFELELDGPMTVTIRLEPRPTETL